MQSVNHSFKNYIIVVGVYFRLLKIYKLFQARNQAFHLSLCLVWTLLHCSYSLTLNKPRLVKFLVKQVGVMEELDRRFNQFKAWKSKNLRYLTKDAWKELLGCCWFDHWHCCRPWNVGIVCWSNPLIAYVLFPLVDGAMICLLPFKVTHTANRFLYFIMLCSITSLVLLAFLWRKEA